MPQFLCKCGCEHQMEGIYGGHQRGLFWGLEQLGSYKPLSPGPGLLVRARVSGSGESGPWGPLGPDEMETCLGLDSNPGSAGAMCLLERGNDFASIVRVAVEARPPPTCPSPAPQLPRPWCVGEKSRVGYVDYPELPERSTWVSESAIQCPCCVTLGRSPYLSEPVLRLRIEALTAPESGRIQ